MVRQIPENTFAGPALTEGACLFCTPGSIAIGSPIEWDCYDDDGLGPAKLALFRVDDGTLFSLQQHELSPRSDLMTLLVPMDDIAGHVDSALIGLGLTSASIGWLPPGITLNPTRLIRQDDNGVVFHVGDYPCRADAEAVIHRLTAGAHKQAYFTEAIASGFPRLQFPSDFRSPPSIQYT